MSCTYTTEELTERREELERELDEMEHDLRSGRADAAMGVTEEFEQKRDVLDTVTDLLEARGEL